MDMTALQEFALGYFDLLTALLCVGFGVIIKHCTPIKNDYIIPLNMLLGVLLSVWINDFSFTPQIVAQGIVSGGAATGFYEMCKNKVENYGQG